MRELGLQGKRKGTVKQKTTDSKHSHAIAENKLERKFDAQKPDQKWVADLTYIPRREGWLFLAIVIDLFSRKIVGWSMSKSLESKVVLDALETARSSRNPLPGLLHHSDRGVQYSPGAHRLALEKFGAISSRKGNCWDNAVSERPKPEGAAVGSRSGLKSGTTVNTGTRAWGFSTGGVRGKASHSVLNVHKNFQLLR
jgi:putative transposase